MERKLIYLFIIFLYACQPADKPKNQQTLIPIDSSEHVLATDTLNEDDMFEEEIGFNTIDSALSGLNLKKGNNYQATKGQMNSLRNKLFQEFLLLEDSIQRNRFLDSAMHLFTSNLLNRIIPYWYGTEWDFEGHTAKPNDGYVACGYFVSTTLRDMGLNINRYKMAQQAGSNEAKTLALSKPDNIIHFSCSAFDYFLEYTEDFNDGLYFVGLDCHVGYYYKKGKQNYFIHSDYINGLVMIENCEYSEAFNSSIYYFAKISSNRALALMWLQNKEIQIIR